MNFSYYIAKRYLFSKTSNNAINIITIIASFGVIVGALALFIILSGFSGLRTFSYAMLDASDPDIKITATQGKSFLVTDAFSKVLDADASIAINSKVIEERVFLKYNNKEVIAFIKGVDRNYHSDNSDRFRLRHGNMVRRSVSQYGCNWQWNFVQTFFRVCSTLANL